MVLLSLFIKCDPPNDACVLAMLCMYVCMQALAFDYKIA